MKYLTLTVAGYLLTGLLTVSPAKGDCTNAVTYRSHAGYVTNRVSYSYPTYSYPTVSYPAVVKKVVTHDYKKDDYHFYKFVAVVPLVELPTYSSQYVPPYAHAQPNPNAQAKSSDDVKQILDLLKDLSGRVKVLESRNTQPLNAAPNPAQGTQPQPNNSAQAQPSPLDVKIVNKQKCAACHERGNETLGGGLVLSEKDGSLVQLSNEKLGDLEEQITTNAMPKINKKAKDLGITALTDQEYAAWRQEISRQRAANKKKG